MSIQSLVKKMVGMRGFEPPTSRSRTERATELRYIPTYWNEILPALFSVKQYQCPGIPPKLVRKVEIMIKQTIYRQHPGVL
jgi:hypothetical protein